jgi:cell division protein FtsW
VLVLIPGIGKDVNGDRRLDSVGFMMTMQPSEVMKLLAVLYATDYTVRKAAFMHDFRKAWLHRWRACFRRRGTVT